MPSPSDPTNEVAYWSLEDLVHVSETVSVCPEDSHFGGIII